MAESNLAPLTSQIITYIDGAIRLGDYYLIRPEFSSNKEQGLKARADQLATTFVQHLRETETRQTERYARCFEQSQHDEYYTFVMTLAHVDDLMRRQVELIELDEEWQKLDQLEAQLVRANESIAACEKVRPGASFTQETEHIAQSLETVHALKYRLEILTGSMRSDLEKCAENGLIERDMEKSQIVKKVLEELDHLDKTNLVTITKSCQYDGAYFTHGQELREQVNQILQENSYIERNAEFYERCSVLIGEEGGQEDDNTK